MKKTCVVFLSIVSVLFVFGQAFASDATLAWNAVSSAELAGYKLYYGTVSGSYGTSIVVGNSTSYTISGLQAGTTYYIAITAYDSALKESPFSAEITATTPQTAPSISNVQNTLLTSNSATISWNTNLASDSNVDYGLDTSYGLTASNSSNVTSHIGNLANLNASTQYHYRVRSKTSTGVQSASADFTLTTLTAADTTPPVITGIASSSITYSGAAISWTTNEGATSQVQYGTTSLYGSASTLNSTLQTSHYQALGGLSPSTTYHYRVVSKDSAGNIATSPDFTFRTAKRRQQR